MYAVQLFLLILISTFETTAARSVTRFKMKSCITTRNVTFVGGFEVFYHYSFYNIDNGEFYYNKLKRRILSYNNDLSCFSMSLTLVTPHGIIKRTSFSLLFDMLYSHPNIDLLDEIPSGDDDFRWSKYFLQQYGKEMMDDDSQDKLLVFYQPHSANALMKDIEKLRKITPVIYLLHSLKVLPEIKLPRHQLVFFPQQEKNDWYTYLLAELLHNPNFDRYEFTKETPYEKNISCLRNTTIVWVTGEYPHTWFHYDLLYEFLFVFSKKSNFNIYRLRPLDTGLYKRPFSQDLKSSIINKGDLLTDVLKPNLNSTFLADNLSYCINKNGGKVVYIGDTYSFKRHFPEIFTSLLQEKRRCFVELYKTFAGRAPFFKQNKMYFSDDDSDIYQIVNLLLEKLIDMGC